MPAAEFSVDSFFWLSGFLVTYLTVNELKTKKRVNWVLYYFHRVSYLLNKQRYVIYSWLEEVWRLSPAYYFALFFYRDLSVYMGDGPLWPKYQEQVHYKRKQ